MKDTLCKKLLVVSYHMAVKNSMYEDIFSESSDSEEEIADETVPMDVSMADAVMDDSVFSDGVGDTSGSTGLKTGSTLASELAVALREGSQDWERQMLESPRIRDLDDFDFDD